MKLFVLEPHPKWDYCGGGLVVIARSLEDAHRVAVDYGLRSGIDPDFVFQDGLEPIPTRGPEYAWVLVDWFELPDETIERVVLFSYNYA